MSTRANIFVDYKGKREQFYHHMDGYPEGVGKELLAKLRAALLDAADDIDDKGPEFFGMVYKYFRERLCRSAEYEPEEIGLHGDIEYLYFVNLDEMTVGFTEVKPFCPVKALRKLEAAKTGEFYLYPGQN